jgi:hypothetical protein
MASAVVVSTTVSARATVAALSPRSAARPAEFVVAFALAACLTFAGGDVCRLGIGFAELFHRGLARELDATLVVDEDHFHLDLVAHVDEVGDALDVAIG